MIKYYNDIAQGSDEWLQLRCGILTASEMKHILTPTLKIANNDKERSHLYELAAQRINKYVEPSYISDDMLRGVDDEFEARLKYAEKFSKVDEVGFITNDKWGFTLGCSPDGLVGEDGLIEIKSRRQKYQVETILSKEMPSDYLLQVQSLLLISERKWCDFISYCGGMPMFVIRIYPDSVVQDAILNAATAFEARLATKLAEYEAILRETPERFVQTERKIYQEITI